MGDLFKLIWCAVFGWFRSRASAPTDRSLRLARNAAVYHSRSRWRLRRALHPAPRRDGDTGSTDRARSPWQNGYAERVIGSIRRDCLDHVVVVGEEHLRHLLNSYQKYYNGVRTHLSLRKDSPVPRDVSRTGCVRSVPILGGLHHQYVRV